MSTLPKIVFVYNPVSLEKHAGIHLGQILHKIRSSGFEVMAFSLQPVPWEAELLLQLRSAAALIVAGGDGSLNLAVNALLHTPDALEKENGDAGLLPVRGAKIPRLPPLPPARQDRYVRGGNGCLSLSGPER